MTIIDKPGELERRERSGGAPPPPGDHDADARPRRADRACCACSPSPGRRPRAHAVLVEAQPADGERLDRAAGRARAAVQRAGVAGRGPAARRRRRARSPGVAGRAARRHARRAPGRAAAAGRLPPELPGHLARRPRRSAPPCASGSASRRRRGAVWPTADAAAAPGQAAAARWLVYVTALGAAGLDPVPRRGPAAGAARRAARVRRLGRAWRRRDRGPAAAPRRRRARSRRPAAGALLRRREPWAAGRGHLAGRRPRRWPRWGSSSIALGPRLPGWVLAVGRRRWSPARFALTGHAATAPPRWLTGTGPGPARAVRAPSGWARCCRCSGACASPPDEAAPVLRRFSAGGRGGRRRCSVAAGAALAWVQLGGDAAALTEHRLRLGACSASSPWWRACSRWRRSTGFVLTPGAGRTGGPAPRAGCG